MPKDFFPKVKEAREALRAKALELYELQVAIIREALVTGKVDVAAAANQWLIEHMPEEEGVRMIDASIDKPKQIEGQAGPQINIGFALGGMNAPKELPSVNVIDVTPEPKDE